MGEKACVKKKPFHGERHRLDEVRKTGDTGLVTSFPFLVLSLPKDQPYFMTLTSIRQLYILKCSLHDRMTSRNNLNRTPGCLLEISARHVSKNILGLRPIYCLKATSLKGKWSGQITATSKIISYLIEMERCHFSFPEIILIRNCSIFSFSFRALYDWNGPKPIKEKFLYLM